MPPAAEILKLIGAVLGIIGFVIGICVGVFKLFVSKEIKEAVSNLERDFNKAQGIRDEKAQLRTDSVLQKIDEKFGEITNGVSRLDVKFALREIVQTQLNEVNRRLVYLEDERKAR